MRRSPLAYPLNRAADTDVGGAADLQTDVMRFMAILALCLVAIFALVQSIPLTPAEPEPVASRPAPAAAPPAGPAEIPKARPAETPKAEPAETPKADPVVASRPTPAEAAPAASEPEGFTLRFASDAALARAVAAHHVGLYALESGRAKRMTVSESRISFWDASMPRTFHEMETGTVPEAVVRALARTGTATENVSWGVTLPGGMKAQLDSLMQEHRGGSLIIGAGGEIHWEDS